MSDAADTPVQDAAEVTDDEATARLTIQNAEDIAVLAGGLARVGAALLQLATAVVGPDAIAELFTLGDIAKDAA